METMETKEKKGVDDKDIIVSRLINAPRELVYKACTVPEQMAQWWGPFGFTNPVCELDVRVGGKWRVEQKGPDGTIYKFGGVYKEVVKNERIVWTFIYEGFPDSESLGILSFEDKNGKTLVTITTRLKTVEEKIGMMKYGADMGTKQAFERLENFLSGNTTANREMNITRIINAPRELVFEVFTKPEHIKNWWGPRGFTNTINKMEFKNGGKWDLIMHGPDGKDFPNTHYFEEIITNEKIVMRHATGPKFQLTFSFIPQGDDKTLLSVRSLFESEEQLKKAVQKFKADVGFKQNIDKLEEYLAKNFN
jgi:uncharacterized protein YndB with AHSA1/START domain